MKLYWATPMVSLAILILAYEKDIPIGLVQLELETGLFPDGRRLIDISPKNCIPVLERDDGSILTETPIMLDWLAGLDGDLSFTAPARSEEHVRICEWMAYFASEQHKLYTLLFWNIDDAAKQAVKQRIDHRFRVAEAALETSDYLVGGSYSIADIYLFIVYRGAVHLIEGFDPSVRFPHIHALADRIAARPAVQRAMRDHNLADDAHRE